MKSIKPLIKLKPSNLGGKISWVFEYHQTQKTRVCANDCRSFCNRAFCSSQHFCWVPICITNEYEKNLHQMAIDKYDGKKLQVTFNHLTKIPYEVAVRWITYSDHNTLCTCLGLLHLKGFHFILLSGVVTSKCLFWDYDIGWASSMYNLNMWKCFTLKQFFEVGRLNPYVLVSDLLILLGLGCFPYTKSTKMD